MKRINELVSAARENFPDDIFFKRHEDSFVEKLDHYRRYNEALMCLDEESWAILKTKAIERFPAERKGQTKEPFFNLLNEAFAYEYLQRQGFEDIKFMKEGEKKTGRKPGKTPDISYVDQTTKYCEVKTLGKSKAAIDSLSNHGFYYVDHTRLNDQFLNKLRHDVNDARKHIDAVHGAGIAFILVRFDDFSNDFIQTYRAQLTEFCETEKDVVIKLRHMRNHIIRSPGLHKGDKQWLSEVEL